MPAGGLVLLCPGHLQTAATATVVSKRVLQKQSPVSLAAACRITSSSISLIFWITLMVAAVRGGLESVQQ